MKNIKSFDEFTNENWSMSNSAADKLVSSVETNWDKNKTPLTQGDLIKIDTKFLAKYIGKYILNSDIFGDYVIMAWNGSATNMKRDLHSASFLQYGISADTSEIEKVPEDELRIAKSLYKLYSNWNKGNISHLFSGFLKSYLVVMYIDGKEICIKSLKDRYNEPTPAELKKIIAFCESNSIEYKGTFDLTGK